MTWKRRDSRSYKRETKHTQGFIFGCSRPVQLWAWVVFWSHGKASGVESGLHQARAQAEDCAGQVEGRWAGEKE